MTNKTSTNKKIKRPAAKVPLQPWAKQFIKEHLKALKSLASK